MKAYIFYLDWKKYTVPHDAAVHPDDAEAYKMVYIEMLAHLRAGGRKGFMQYIFEVLNSDAPRGFRSMSVGDVVILEDLDVWVIAPIGFERRLDLREWARYMLAKNQAEEDAWIAEQIRKPLHDEDPHDSPSPDYIYTWPPDQEND